MSEAIREPLGALERGRATGVLSALDYQFAKRLGDLYGVSEEGLGDRVPTRGSGACLCRS
jgi:hypothetical protein